MRRITSVLALALACSWGIQAAQACPKGDKTAGFPTLVQMVGDKAIGCPMTAKKMAETSGKKVVYVLGEQKFGCEVSANKALADATDLHLKKFTTIACVIDGKADYCGRVKTASASHCSSKAAIAKSEGKTCGSKAAVAKSEGKTCGSKAAVAKSEGKTCGSKATVAKSDAKGCCASKAKLAKSERKTCGSKAAIAKSEGKTCSSKATLAKSEGKTCGGKAAVAKGDAKGCCASKAKLAKSEGKTCGSKASSCSTKLAKACCKGDSVKYLVTGRTFDAWQGAIKARDAARAAAKSVKMTFIVDGKAVSCSTKVCPQAKEAGKVQFVIGEEKVNDEVQARILLTKAQFAAAKKAGNESLAKL